MSKFQVNITEIVKYPGKWEFDGSSPFDPIFGHFRKEEESNEEYALLIRWETDLQADWFVCTKSDTSYNPDYQHSVSMPPPKQFFFPIEKECYIDHIGDDKKPILGYKPLPLNEMRINAFANKEPRPKMCLRPYVTFLGSSDVLTNYEWTNSDGTPVKESEEFCVEI